MPSFAALSLIATLAFGAFTSAAPVDLSSVPVAGEAVTDAVATVSGATGDVLPAGVLPVGLRRDATPRSLAVILTDVTTQVTPLTQQLTFIQASNATSEVISPITDQLKSILSGAVSEINGLVGQPATVIKADLDGTAQIAEADLAKIVANVICLIVTALGAVLKVAGGQLDVLKPVLSSAATLVGSLLAAVLHLVGDLLSILLPLLQNAIPTITSLNVTSLTSILGIQI